MNREQVTERILANRLRLKELGVDSLSLFGSVARGEATNDSDIDFLVCFKGQADFDRYMDLKIFLEDLLGRKIDLVTEKALRKEIRAGVERDLLRVA